MNIFEQLDVLLKSTQKINEESKKPTISYSDIPIASEMENEKQAIEYVRKYFIDTILSGKGPGPGPFPGTEDSEDEGGEILPPTPPLPPIIKDHLPIFGGDKDEKKDWKSEEVEWGEDEFIEKLKLEADSLEEKDEDSDYKEGDDYDDFLDPTRDSVSSGEDGTGEGGEGGEGDSDEDGVDGDYDDDDDEKEGKGGKKKSELERSIEDALEKISERTEAEKDVLRDIRDVLRDESKSEEDIEKLEKEIDKSKDKKKYETLKGLAGKLEKTPSREAIEKELEAAKLSPEDVKRMKEETLESALSVEPPTDAELDTLRREAMAEMEKKCKGHSELASSILYHSIKAAKIEDQDWEKIIEKILTDVSIPKGDFEEKRRRIKLGDKNHLWRHDVRYTRDYVKGGKETQSIYCFVDYSGSVSSRPGLIAAFLGKILELCYKLEYTDVTAYAFGNHLSLPRVVNNKMLQEDGYEKTLANTLEYFKSQSGYIGGSIENFSEVGLEINRIKSKDKNAKIFIFGDGYWTFYKGQTDPPKKLLEICPHWIKDIIAFIFFENEEEIKINKLGKEISVLKDVVEIPHVVVTKVNRMKESEWDKKVGSVRY